MKTRISMPEQLAREFKRRIAAGAYPPHSFLPPERELSKEFETSRDTVAAALAILTNEGITERCRGRGTRVLHWQASHEQTVCIIHGPFNLPWPEGFFAFGGVQEVLTRHGFRYELIGQEDPEYVLDGQWPPLTNEQIKERFGGVIYLESLNCDEQILELQSEGFPTVVSNLEVDLDVTCSWVNHGRTSTSAVKTLAGLGHKRIAYLGRSGAHFYSKAVAGYRAGLEESGLDPDESLLGIVEESSSLLAYLKARDLLALPNPPTAIVAARDLYAEGACQAAREAGLVIGRDLSVIGYDDMSWQQADPFLTTFREPCHEMGTVAAELFLERALHTTTAIVKREIESPFIIRKSAGPLL